MQRRASALRTAPPSRNERPPLRAPSRLPAARLTHCAMALWIWSASRRCNLAAATAAPKIPNTGPAWKAARHDGRDELGGHALHDFVAGGDGGQELLAGSAGDLRRDEGGRQDRDAGMGQHAEGVPLAAGEDRLRVDEGGPGLGELRRRGTARSRPRRRPPLPPASRPAPAGFAGMSRATSAELSACRVTPFARSTTSGGRFSYWRPATNPANSRLSDMMGPFARTASAYLSCR